MESSEYCKPAARSMATPLRSRAGCEAMAPVFRGLQVGSPSSPIVENRTLRQGETFYEGLKVLKENGTYLNLDSSSNNTKIMTEDLVFLKDLVEAGRIRSVIDRRYSLDQIVEAHRYVDEGHKKGNVIITVAHDSTT